MRHIIMILSVVMACGPIYAATEQVAPRRVLEIQPFVNELGNYFSDAAQQVLSDSGYVWDAQMRSDYYVVDAEQAKLLLESGNNGLLLYGSHGHSDGSIGIESHISLQAATTRRNELIEFLFFGADEIGVGQAPDGTWMILLATSYTNIQPAACDVAIIASCYGSAVGDFNANHRLAGSGVCSNQAFINAYSALMLYLQMENFRTLASAQAQVTLLLQNQTFVNPFILVSGGNIKFFFECTPEQRLFFASSSTPPSECPSGAPDAAIDGFRVVDGLASWYSVFEEGTQEYSIYLSTRMSGPWDHAVSDVAGVGAHHVPLQLGPHHRYARLVEVEMGGSTRVLDVAPIWTSNHVEYVEHGANARDEESVRGKTMRT